MVRLRHSEVTLLNKVGQGAFGTVYKAVHHGNNVAIKIVATKNEAYGERRRIASLSHKNIVGFLGLVYPDGSSTGNVPWLMMEYVAGGSLLENLKNGKISKNQERSLIIIAHGVACGMEYLHSRNILHRDIAARNVLVVSLATCQVKICDFGLSVSNGNQNDHYYKGGNGTILPIRWMPAENFDGHFFSRKGDVWAFGVLLFEMWSSALIPYADVPNCQVEHYVTSSHDPLDNKFLTDCPHDIIELMYECWSRDKNNRPNFRAIRRKFEKNNPEFFNS